VKLAATATVTTPAFRGLLSRLRARAGTIADEARRGAFRWALALIERAGHGEGRLAQATLAARKLSEYLALAARKLSEYLADSNADPLDAVQLCRPEGSRLRTVHNGQIGLAFVEAAAGELSLAGLFDFASGREYLDGAMPSDVFQLELSDAEGKTLTIGGADVWREARISTPRAVPDTDDIACTITWEDPAEEALAGLNVEVKVHLTQSRSEWSVTVDNPSTEWGLTKVHFPRVNLRHLDEGDDYLIAPHGSGTLTRDPIGVSKVFNGTYPSGWCAMQLGGYYDSAGGVYFAAHDPLASNKTITLKQNGSALLCDFGWFAPEMGVPGNDFSHPGTCAIELFSGDWFDAAQIYKRWAREEAKWWPEDEAREDIPQWMREISIWALQSGGPENVVDPCIKLREYMGVPTAVHWYSWHKIPFDDDYPHYFPTKDGFAEAVKTLHEHDVRVMPYINGRLWDTDTEDFPTLALPAATKNQKGEPYTEEYGSKQKLAPMCPTTKLWQDKVQEIVLRLVGPEYDVDGVYIDQIGAAAPRQCFDKTHGHPLGGGDWWCTQGYWPMLTSLQQRLPEGKMITTECNADPYCRWMDGYLSWHFQYQDQIPLFAAIYGGKVQIFSRAYRGSDNLAYRMKAAQSLVYGEQIGWLNASHILNDPEVEGPFFRRMARLRHALLPYLSWGDMARLTGPGGRTGR